MMQILSIVFSALTFLGCRKADYEETEYNKSIIYKGISLESPPTPEGVESFNAMQEVKANSVALIPFGFIGRDNPTVIYDETWQWWGEKSVGITSLTRDAHANGFKVMIKPQVWIGGGAFTGTYNPGSEEGWQKLESSYLKYILHFADIAQAEKVALFCIGTEWKVFMLERSEFWGNLIDSVRAHYAGKLTYAGNWDSYKAFPHWSKLDFMGIDAYFPVSDAKSPTTAQCMAGWVSVKTEIKREQSKYGIPVIFTEYGYRNIDYCAKEPWHSGKESTNNMMAQVNAYQGLYKTFWKEPWFAGGFLWKWHLPHSEAGGAANNRFTPQNKPVEVVIKEWYQ